MTDTAICLVSGGAGFIGSHLCDALLQKGYHVICVDNLITGRAENNREALSNERFIFIHHDISHTLTSTFLHSCSHVTHVFHLASPASVIDYQQYPEETALANSSGTLNMLRIAKHSHSKFLFASTSEIYGDPLEHPQAESYWGNVNPTGIRSCYDESKRFGEMMTMLYHRKYGLDARIIRIFNTYGPRMRKTDGRVVANLVSQALSDKPLSVYGNGLHTRSFCYISDLIEGLLKSMFFIKTNGEIFNLGNPHENRIIDLARLIQQMVGQNSEIIHAELPEDDPAQRKPDIAKAIHTLRWEPKIELKAGLRLTVQYFQSNEQ